jgi:phosphatidylglycerophosphatase B
LIVVYLVLLCAVWALPIAFTACTKDSWWCRIAYWLTESAGKMGTIVIVITAAFLYTFNSESLKEKFLLFFKSVFSIGLLLSVMAFFNENVTKEIIKIARPSQKFIIEQSGIITGLDSLYMLNDKGRREFIDRTIDSHSESFANIDAKVLGHWIAESGYSFPSGHSCNAFLLACILAYSVYHSTNKGVRFFFVLPLIWAIMVGVSRVAIGAHTALDVSVGSALGMAVAMVFLYFETTRKWIISKT